MYSKSGELPWLLGLTQDAVATNAFSVPGHRSDPNGERYAPFKKKLIVHELRPSQSLFKDERTAELLKLHPGAQLTHELLQTLLEVAPV